MANPTYQQSPVISQAKQHYQDLPENRLEVPEWGAGGDPLIVTWRALTLEDKRAVYRRNRDGQIPEGDEIMVRALIRCARGEGGEKLFEPMDEKSLRYDVDSRVVAKIADAILSGINLDDEAGETGDFDDRMDREKNA